MRARRRSFSDRHEALLMGAVGATTAWSWLFVADLYNRTPFSTPIYLGWLLLAPFGATDAPRWGDVLVFTGFLWLAYLVLARAVVVAVRRSHGNPPLLLLVVTVLILLQLAAIVLTAMFASIGMQGAAWRDLLVGQLIGCTSAGWWLVRRHPSLGEDLRRSGRW